MSGICGLFNLDASSVTDPELWAMTAMLEKRGSQRTGTWLSGHVGLGHTLLATTPESLFESQPFTHEETGCVVTADVRLDYREELLDSLGLDGVPNSIGDAELILRSYLRWGQDCVDRLLGDFAFAIWDPRQQVLFCARDHFGMRPLYYHYQQGKRLLFASEARAILVLPQVPFAINEGRVADFLVPELEWSDFTSTFYEDIYRLPPGHKAIASRSGFDVAAYWRPEPGPELSAASDDEYRQGFAEVFTNAIDARLRAPVGTVGAMLSGGMDTGSIVAIGKEILRQRGEGPLATFSAARPESTIGTGDLDCPESRAIYAASSMPGVAPTIIHPDALADAYEALTSDFDEPFDGVFAILKAIYLAAHDKGIQVVLDGGGGDVVLHERSYIRRLMRKGQLKLAIAEIAATQRYWGQGSPALSVLRHARSAMLPEFVRKPLRAFRYRRNYRAYVKASLISPEFARSVRIEDRIERMRRAFPTECPTGYATEYCGEILPNMTAGRERYARIAASTGVEARDPFMDRRVIEYCSRLPGRFRLRDGWPKVILRDIAADILPDEVLWTHRKPHIGWLFSEAISKLAMGRGDLDISTLQGNLGGYVDTRALSGAWREFLDTGEAEQIHNAHVLSMWLRRNAARPSSLTLPNGQDFKNAELRHNQL